MRAITKTTVGAFASVLLVGSLTALGGGASAAASSTPAIGYSTSTTSLVSLGTHNVKNLANAQPQTTPNQGNELLSFGPSTSPLVRTGGGSNAPTAPTTKGKVGGPQHTGGFIARFPGITGKQQAAANQAYDLEPPDQGLCSNGTQVVEMVNNAVAVYDTSGNLLAGPVAASSVFGVPSESSGYFTSDPRCYYDGSTGHWFMVELGIPGLFSAHGHATKSYELIAVSDGASATSNFAAFAIPTADQSNPGCPCFGDYPMIGADANGFYITTNEFPIYKAGYNGAQLYAMSKQGLVNAAEGTAGTPTVVHISQIASPFPSETVGQTYHISPAMTPSPASYDTSNGGTEYFTMSDAFPTSASSLAVYALTNTGSLGTPAPSVTLTAGTVGTQTYAYPANSVAVQQRPAVSPSQTPLLSYITGQTGTQPPEGVLQSDFDAVQETTYVDGHLYTALDNVASTSGRQSGSTVGTMSAEWFNLTAQATSSNLSLDVAGQGNFGISGQSLLYPDLVVNGAGVGDLVFTLVGPSYYPSAAYVPFTGTSVGSTARLAAAGSGPEDGFTCYSYYVGSTYGGCRWGDYSGGVAVGNTVWMATEYVPPASTRDFYTNWGTYIFATTAG